MNKTQKKLKLFQGKLSELQHSVRVRQSTFQYTDFQESGIQLQNDDFFIGKYGQIKRRSVVI